jgi:hypothetical protein
MQPPPPTLGAAAGYLTAVTSGVHIRLPAAGPPPAAPMPLPPVDERVADVHAAMLGITQMREGLQSVEDLALLAPAERAAAVHAAAEAAEARIHAERMSHPTLQSVDDWLATPELRAAKDAMLAMLADALFREPGGLSFDRAQLVSLYDQHYEAAEGGRGRSPLRRLPRSPRDARRPADGDRSRSRECPGSEASG